MRFKNELCLVGFLAFLMLGMTSLIVEGSQASTEQDVQFRVIDWGHQSGYLEETYLIVRNEAEWAKVWEKHIALCIPKTQYPKIVFSKNMVICAFMGNRPTTGYSISVERIWTDGERIHVEIAKCSPPKDAIVGQVLTHPYVFTSIERTDLEVVFRVTEEDGTINEYTLPEFPMVTFALIVFMVLSAAMVALTRKTRGKQQNLMT